MRERWNWLRKKLGWTRISSAVIAFWAAIPLWLKWLAVGLAAVWMLWVVPSWQVAHTSSGKLALENEVRKTLAQIIGGVFALLALYFTWRRVVAGDRTVRITEQGHITDRFTKAIEQLGKSDGEKPNIEIRLGAIYALERVALDSPRDHWTIMEILTAYIRQNAPAVSEEQELPKVKLRTDIQAVLTVLGRRKTGPDREKEEQVVDLNQTNLCNAYLLGAKLQGANLNGAQLQRANLNLVQLQNAALRNTELQGATLKGAQLQGANACGAQIQEAKLREAHLQGAYLEEAQLQRADLRGAQLQKASLREAQLQRADLEGAQLQGAILSGAQFQGANLRETNFRTTRLNIDQIDSIRAAQNWEEAFYDPEFAYLLGLTSTAEPAEDRN